MNDLTDYSQPLPLGFYDLEFDGDVAELDLGIYRVKVEKIDTDLYTVILYHNWDKRTWLDMGNSDEIDYLIKNISKCEKPLSVMH